jgi:hypothetical protein
MGDEFPTRDVAVVGFHSSSLGIIMRIGILKGILLGGENFSISAWQLRSAPSRAPQRHPPADTPPLGCARACHARGSRSRRSALEPGGAPGPAPRTGDATGVAAQSAPMHLCRGDPAGSVLPRLPEVFSPGHP